MYRLIQDFLGCHTDKPEQLTQIRCHKKWGLIRVYTICHSHQFIEVSSGCKMDMFKLLDKYGKQLIGLDNFQRGNSIKFVFAISKKRIYSKRKEYCCHLTLKMPRKSASESVVCLCLLNILANFSNLFLHTGKQCGP